VNRCLENPNETDPAFLITRVPWVLCTRGPILSYGPRRQEFSRHLSLSGQRTGKPA
jgi:hypothetical protein